MSKFLTRLSMILIGLLVAGGLAFGATEAFGSNSLMVCNQPEELGTCPGQFDQEGCETACLMQYGQQGDCFGGCCVCLI